MQKHGKRYTQALTKIDLAEPASTIDALNAVKSAASAKFDETVEVAIRLGVDPRQSDQMVRGSVVLPHGTGKSPKIAVFTRDADAALAAGADIAGAEDLVDQIDKGFKDFDILVASRDMMGIVGKLGRKLGPRMPNPKAGTVTDDIPQAVKDLKGGKATFRVDKAANVHVPIGKVSYSVDQLEENFMVLFKAILRQRPASSKGTYVKKISVTSTMGPAFKVDTYATIAKAGK